MRVVGSLTTIPGRYPKLLRTLRSLVNQDYPLDVIYLGVPELSRRLQQPYPQLPPEITDLVTVVPCEHDYGPLTKIAGGLIAEDDPETVVITFDDDVVYSPGVVRALLNYHRKYPESAVGSSGVILKYGFPFYSTISNCTNHWNSVTGFSLGPEGRKVDALCGFSAVLYVRKFFPVNSRLHDDFFSYPLRDNNVYCNDDIMISAYLSGQQVERRVVLGIPVPNETKAANDELDALDGNELSFDKLAFLTKFKQSIIKCQEWGFFAEPEDAGLDETIGGRVAMAIILGLIVILAVILFYTMN